MIRLKAYLCDRFSYLRDEHGVETLEWILIGGIVTGVAAGTYSVLGGDLDSAVTSITNAILGPVP